MPRQQSIARPRLTERLDERFRVRLTTVTGAAGSGKTTLLAQTLGSGGDDLDVWYACSLPDHDAARLLVGIVTATADALDEYRPTDLDEPLAALRDLLLGVSPRQACIVLDDAHLLGHTEVLDQLLRSLPRNGHLLIAGRSMPELDVARLDALGDLVEIQQHDLMMTPDELVEFASRRGVDVDQLAGADGWPAFVELASAGVTTRPREFLEQEALSGLDDARRTALAQLAFVGGGDDEIARAVTGQPVDEVLGGLPLVRWQGDHAQLHDLWVELLSDELTQAQRRAAAGAACEILMARHDYERVVLLGAAAEDWDAVATGLAGAIRDGIESGIQASQFERWSAMLPPHVAESPIGRLVDGVIERERDPTSERTSALFLEAADGFSEIGDDELELVALLQLGYVARMSGRPERLAPVIERVERLSERYPAARPYLAFGEAWTALAMGRPDQQLAAMESIVEADLPIVWARSRDHLIAHALFNLGQPDEALAWAPATDESLPIPVPGALVTRLQCLWYAGRPEEAIAERVGGLGPRHGARDRFIAGGWTAMMEAFAGDVDAATSAISVARAHAGELPAQLVAAQIVAVDLLITLVGGDEERAAAELAALLEQVPLGQGISEQMLRSVLPIPYVMVPESRRYWDEAELGPSLRRSRRIARAFVADRAGDSAVLAGLDYPEPGVIAANLPGPWAVEFGLRSVRAGRAEGRRLVAWLCEHWGDPARESLRRFERDVDLGEIAREVMSQTPLPPSERIQIGLLGTSTVTVNGYETADPDWRRERVRALIAWLAVHRRGTRDQLAAALWPDLDGAKSQKNLRTTLNYLHKLLEPRRSSGDATWFVQIDGSNVRLNPNTEVDAWHFVELLDRAAAEQRAGRTSASLPLLLSAVELYQGDLSNDLDHPWLDLERIHLQSRFVLASCRAGELLTATGRSADAIEVLRRALATDPFHEASYLALAEAYSELGDTTSAQRILELAAANLGELGDTRLHASG